MNNEFKKITEGSITRYVLEFAGGGGGGGATTGAGSVGTGIAQPMGGVHHRKGDNLISQENKKSYKVSHKPKNPVAKAHQTVGSGSGQHKDKTKVLPRQEKHKKPASALAESTTDHEAQMARSELYRNAKYAMGMLKMINPGDELEGWVESSLTKAAGALDKDNHYLDYETKFEKGIDHSDKQPEDEVVEDAEEASIARENLMLIAEYSMKLFKMIKDGDDLEGWVFMKLTKASEMISSAKHHLEYHHFQQHGLEGEEDPEDVKEGTDPRAERNMYIRAIHKATGWDISHLELASDDELKDLYQQHCHTDEDHNINPGWGAGSYDTYTDGRHGRGVAEVATVANRKFPNPRKPYIENGKVTGIMGPDGKKYMMSKSDTVGADGMIYHWQDPRARGKTGQQGVAKKEQGTSGSIQEAPGTADEIAKFILANIYDRGALQKYAFQTPNPTLFWNGVERAKQGGRFNDIVQVVTPTRPWHKMEESDVEEEPGQHRVAVKVTDPKTQDDVQKVVRVNASSKQGALERAEEYYTKKGMYVVNAKYLGKVDQGVAEGIDPFVAGKLNKLKDLNPVDRASAYGGIRSWLKDNPELAGQASKLASAYAMADVARQQYKTAQAKQMLADLEPQHQAFIKQALGQEQGVAEGWKGGAIGGAVSALAGPEAIPVGMAVGDKVGDWVGGKDMDEGAMDELHADLSDKYNELAPSIEKYKDEKGADNLYRELLAIAKQHGAEREFSRMCNGARNSAHMDYDTNPGHFKNWFWYLGLGDNQGVREGIVDKVRAANYDRLSKRSYNQADKTKPGQVSVYDVNKMKKGDERDTKANKLKGVAEADSYMESLAATLAEKLKPNDPPEKYIHYFLKGAQTPNAKGHHQFRNKSKAKVIQMANAASYAAKEKK